ncbi:MAG: SDR family oxidoreductase [Actinomycetota bacterium]|nr:SDR family oxidoreductase [Actinomycetota bacterium]
MRWQRALVTGASAGIGEGFARRLARTGCDLVLVARRSDALESLAEDLRNEHRVDVEVLTADLTVEPEVERVEARLKAERSAIDLLVNNAGGSDGNGRGPFVDQSFEILHGQALLNAIAVMRLTHAAVRAMCERGQGHVIQVSAGTAFYPVPHGAVYGASKAFVNSFSEAVAHELRGTGVAITTVCPGFTRTDAPRRIGFSETNIPSWWWADPDEVVEAALEGASQGKVIVSPKVVNRLNAVFGRVFRRTMMKMSARVTASDPG